METTTMASTTDAALKDGETKLGKAPSVYGQRLMCVWQAVSATDPSSKGPKATRNLVRKVTLSFTEHPKVKIAIENFDEFFQGDTVDFDQYCEYVYNKLVPHAADGSVAVEDVIEDMCWELCKATYDLDNYGVPELESYKLWQLFNRLCEPGTMLPVMNQEDAGWIGKQLNHTWDCGNIEHNMTYCELMKILAEKCFSACSQVAVVNAIEALHGWLVQEIMMTGWLNVRSRNQANWTSWLPRWCKLVPGGLVCYDNDKMECKKGEFPLNSSSMIKELKTHQFRFKVMNSLNLELELEAADGDECMAWRSSLTGVVDAAKDGTTPIQAILKDRQVQKERGTFVSFGEAASKSTSMRLPKNVQLESPESLEPKPLKTIEQKMPSKMPSKMKNQDERFRQQLKRIEEIFNKVDLNRNGSICANEFIMFIKKMGLGLSDDEIIKIFSHIETSGDCVITIDEFTDYFMNNVLDETGELIGEREASLQAAFLGADRDGTGTVDFREFSEYLWEKRRSARMGQLMSAFDKVSGGKDEINIDQFKDFHATLETSHVPLTDADNRVGDLFKNMFDDTDADRITSFLHDRWTAYRALKRTGKSGDSVMTSGEEMVADVLPGQYNLVDLACFSDLPPIEPRHATIRNVSWVNTGPDGHGRAIFPADFDGKIPIEIATTEHLRYYGASLANSTGVKVSLMYRHGIQDFTYENAYLSDYVQADAGGCGIEKHEFAHLDCPMANDSGYFVMGKMEKGELHLTAFKVPTRHTLYIPGGVIHSNDYLKGTWRTMLSDEADIDHVHIVKNNKDNEDVTKFTFLPED